MRDRESPSERLQFSNDTLQHLRTVTRSLKSQIEYSRAAIQESQRVVKMLRDQQEAIERSHWRAPIGTIPDRE